MSADLSRNEFYSQTNAIRNYNEWKYFQKSKHEVFRNTSFNAKCKAVLVADIPASKKQGRNQSQNHNSHGSFQVDGIVDVNPIFGRAVRRKKECLDGTKSRTEFGQFATLLEMRLIIIYQFPERFHGYVLLVSKFFNHQMDSVAQNALNFSF